MTPPSLKLSYKSPQAQKIDCPCHKRHHLRNHWFTHVTKGQSHPVPLQSDMGQKQWDQSFWHLVSVRCSRECSCKSCSTPWIPTSLGISTGSSLGEAPITAYTEWGPMLKPNTYTIFIDLKEAFDRLNPIVNLTELNKYVKGKMLHLIGSVKKVHKTQFHESWGIGPTRKRVIGSGFIRKLAEK